MKKLIITWTVFAIIFELVILYSLDKFILVDSYKFEVNETTKEQPELNEINTVIKEDADNINISYNGKYIAYNYDNSLCVEEIKTGTVKKVPTENNEEIMYYKWLEKRQIIAIVEKNKKGEIQLVTYNAANSVKSFVQTICNYSKNMKVDSMATSVLTNVYYININKGNSKNSVYRIDRNNAITKVDIKAKILGNMKTIPHEDRLIYEDKSNGRFYVTNPDQELKFNTNKKLSLLGIDKNDVIYFGELNGDKVISILYGKINESTSQWKTKKLDEPINPDNVYFNDESEIVVNNIFEGNIKNIMTEKETEYYGTSIQVNEDFLASIDANRKLTYTKIDK